MKLLRKAPSVILTETTFLQVKNSVTISLSIPTPTLPYLLQTKPTYLLKIILNSFTNNKNEFKTPIKQNLLTYI